jgi:hypothetical protein
MMKYHRFIAFACLIFASSLQVQAHSDISLAGTSGPSGEARKPAKRSIQVVVLSDGNVVDRLSLTSSAKPAASTSAPRYDALPISPEAWLARMMDSTKNGLAAKNPELFAEWLDAVTEPRFMTALASVAMTPDTYSNAPGKMLDPATVRNWAAFADPQIGLRWMAAGLNPGFYQAVFNRMTDSGKLRRWGISPATRTLEPGLATSSEMPAIAGEKWLQLSQPSSKANPWLLNSANYRY